MNDYVEPVTTALFNREQIVGLLRGRFVVPALACLTSLGLTDRFIQGEAISPLSTDFAGSRALFGLCRYLASLDLLRETHAGFSATQFGRVMLKRAGSACILESYSSYMDDLVDLVQGKTTEADVHVDRKLNILGCGALHQRKFFGPALGLLRRQDIDRLIDLGCGDGSFILQALAQLPGLTDVVAVDLSEQAVEATSMLMVQSNCTATHRGVVANARHVEQWSADLNPGPRKTLISMWFINHEFCGGEPSVVAAFLHEIHRLHPTAEILIGEIVAFEPETLAGLHSASILPEFLFFHALSGQAPMSWAQWQAVKMCIPYRLETELLFDCLDVEGVMQPANFIWHLIPEKIPL